VQTSALLVFLPAEESQLASVPRLSIGIMSATQGSYTAGQLLLDITQGARVADSAYASLHPPAMALRTPGPPSRTGAGGLAVVRDSAGTIAGWQAARRRAENAPQLLRPGLLATGIPGGAAYAGVSNVGGAQQANGHIDAIAAADGAGHVAVVSLGPAPTLLARIAQLRRAHRLVVADLPAGAPGRADLNALAAGRAPGELLLVVQRARAPGGHELLWAAAAGLAPGASGAMALTSQTTNQRGLIAAIDLAPTILLHLGPGSLPAAMIGRPIHTDGPLRSAGLRSLMARLHIVPDRRLPALGFLLAAWGLLLAATLRRRRAWAVRVGATGVLWAPVAALIPAALQPSAVVEYATIAIACLGLGALTDRLLPWPRAALAPAVVAVAALTADGLAGTQLLMRSLLGPDPAAGVRFYGIGNELKSALAVLVLAAVAAALYPVAERRSARGRRAAFAMAGAGVVLAIVEGSARIGAGVGGVILVTAGAAVATIVLLPGALTRRRALIVLIAPVLALVLLAALDLATAHGTGHFTGSVLHARSAGEVRNLIVRRCTAAWNALGNLPMQLATGLALLCAVLGVRRRERLLAPVAGDPAWLAALSGGLAAGVIGALVEDSGPVLLLVAVFALICVLTYLWAGPANRVRRASTYVPLDHYPSDSFRPTQETP
jgi:hypothetical protein